ncbi:Bor family protein [Pontibacter vulgaris]|uniref:Bor family protein n=1 Tax=Pontibacter vulgaris TaxID=2905679 RepID=UPI001FA6E4D0|nr:Bor family protein [Pontibacter vulgaris]
MKKTVKMFAAAMLMSSMLTSCYTYTTVVGNGAQGSTQVKKMNHYVVYGLAPVSVSNPVEMAGGAKDYTVKTEHSFIDGLIAGLTFGIYTPTTTTVTK